MKKKIPRLFKRTRQMSDILLKLPKERAKFVANEEPNRSKLRGYINKINMAVTKKHTETQIMGKKHVKREYFEHSNGTHSFTSGDFFSYYILTKISSGGFSDVYLVERNGNRYAIKISKGIDLDGSDTIELRENDLESYGKEAEIWAMLTEKEPDAVINLIDAGIRPFPCVVMELGERKMKDIMNTVTNEDKLRIAVELLGNMDKIHHYGVVHKDIKPENILYANGEWKFIGFGLSKMINKSSKSSHVMSGTLQYMAPEQISHKKFGGTDWRTDIWQMGVMIYELLTRHTPFEVDDPGELAMSTIMEDPAPAIEYGISEDLWKIIEKALRKKKEDRWQSAIEFKKAIEEVL